MNAPRSHPAATSVRTVPRRFPHGAGYALAVFGAACATALAALAERWAGVDDLSLIFMLAVLTVAARTRIGPAVATAVLCFLAYNFFFIAPRYTFYIVAPQGVATVLMFLIAALLAGRMAAHLAMQVEALHEAARLAAARQALAQRLASAMDEAQIVARVQEVFGEFLGADAWMRVESETPPQAASASAEQHGWWFVPVRAQASRLGSIGLKLRTADAALDSGQRALVATMAEDIAQALVRVRLSAELEAQRMSAETERLRNALLASVSHDLRSPLAGIIGSASSLEHYGGQMSAQEREELLRTIRGEGERLDRYIQNLLDMTRLGHGGLRLHREWIGADELIGAVGERLRACAPQARIRAAISPALPPERASIWVHPALIEQALFNIAENAVKFSPPEGEVRIAAHAEGDALLIDIDDDGPGIPEAERARIFDMFHSAERGDRGRNGTGLGLTIARGMIAAHGGEVEALAGPTGQGTRMRVRLPRQLPPEAAASVHAAETGEPDANPTEANASIVRDAAAVQESAS